MLTNWEDSTVVKPGEEGNFAGENKAVDKTAGEGSVVVYGGENGLAAEEAAGEGSVAVLTDGKGGSNEEEAGIVDSDLGNDQTGTESVCDT